MVDEIFDRHYQAGRSTLNGSLANSFARLRAAVRNAFAVLNRIEYAEPWAAQPKRARTR